MSNPPSAAPPSVAAVARAGASNVQGVAAHSSAGPLGQTQAQGLKRAFEGM
jgi:hypothetical protein